MIPPKEVLAKSVFVCCAIASAAIILAILGFMVALGIPLFRESTFSAAGAEGGNEKNKIAVNKAMRISLQVRVNGLVGVSVGLNWTFILISFL